MEKKYTVIVEGPTGKRLEVDLCDTAEQFQSFTVRQLKEKIIQKYPQFDVFDEYMCLIFIDKRLDDDDKTLSSYGVQHKSLILLVIRLRGGLSPHVTVVGPGGERKEVKVCETEEQLQSITVRQLKEKIEKKFDLPHPGDIRLIFKDKVLKDDETLSSYGVQHMSDIHMVIRLRGALSPQTGVHVTVVGLTGERKELKVCETEEQLQSITVRQLKEKIRQEFDIPPGGLRLTCEDNWLRNYQYLSHYGIQHGSVIKMFSRITGGVGGDRGDHHGSIYQLFDLLDDAEDSCSIL